jgi:hypothetical protein
VLALDDGEEVAPPGSRSPQVRDSLLSRREDSDGVRASRLTFAGLELELTGDADACARVGRVARAGVPAAGSIGPHSTAPTADTPAPKFAASCRLASCRLQMVPPPAADRALPPPSGLGWEWTAQGGELVTRFGGARVWRAPCGAGGPATERTAFEGTAWLAGDARAPHHLLGGLAVLLTHRLGGGVFHAASVELDGAVVAFIGPSGAGKSTACRHVEGAPLVSVDRLALLPLGPVLPLEPVLPLGPVPPLAPVPPFGPLPPSGPRWFAHPLPGGTRPLPDMPGTLPCWRPLAAVLRVRRSATGTAIIAPAPASAVTLLRESTFQTGLQPSAELELLAALEQLVQHVPVARLELQLGASLKPLLRRWLKSQAEERR